MEFDPTRLADVGFFAENRMAPHSDHRWFAGRQEAAAGTSSFEQSLDGQWRVHVANNHSLVPAGFAEPGLDDSGWEDVTVPGHLELQGHGRPQYVNYQYPWDGLEEIQPGQVPTRFNPVATYRTRFTPEVPLGEGERLSVVFGGAESAVACWLNGHYLGYAADSFTPSEFDLTEHLLPGENVLVAQVFRFTAGSWLESQDFFRFSGLFRSVVLVRRPLVHVEDLFLRQELADDLASARVELELTVTDGTGAGSTRARLVSPGGRPLQELDEVAPHRFATTVDAPRLWSPELPQLYSVEVEALDTDGRVVEHVTQPLGVRRFALEDGLLRLNGQRVVFKGVNRHEFGLDGRVVSREQTERDLVLLKQNNVNAVRTSHYPNNSWFYELCDQYGLMVVDEVNLEAHGLWEQVIRGRRTIAEAVPGDDPQWLPMLFDRAESMLYRDRNHPCIVMWSIGNESFGGSDLLAMADHLRGLDDRPVHYEGVFWDPRLPQTTDVTSQMYTPAAAVEQHLRTHRDKPFIMCEYAHAMGNSFGAVEKYLELAEREELFQGGFIWDFADQAVALTDRWGNPFFGYGGDCGEAPHDGDFCGNGLLFADHSPSPKLAEARYLYQPYGITVAGDGFTLANRQLATPSSAHRCRVVLAREGVVLARGVVDTEVAAGAQGTYQLPFALPTDPGEYTVDVVMALREDTSWAPAGHELAHDQGVLRVTGDGAAQRPHPPRPRVVRGTHNIGVHGEHFEALFSILYGGMTSYRHGRGPRSGRQLLLAMPKPNFWHAPTANERGWGMGAEDGQWLLASQYAHVTPMSEPEVTELEHTVRIGYRLHLPTTPPSSCDLAYEVDGDGRVEVSLEVEPGAGLPDMPEFGLQLEVPGELSRLRFHGEGPHESYLDRRGAARLGVWEADVADQLTRYLVPQEAGNHTGVRWAEVTDVHGHGLRLEHDDPSAADDPGLHPVRGDHRGMDFSALPWTPQEVETARHHWELPPMHRTVLRPALMRRGVGGDYSWGARTHPEFCLPRGEKLRFTVTFRGI